MLFERFDKFLNKSDTDKLKEAENLIALLADSPELAERARKRDERRLTRTRELLAALDELTHEQADTLPKLEKARDQAQAEEQRAHEALQAVTKQRVNAEQARLNASLDFSSRRSQLEAELRKHAPPEIDEFLSDLHKKADEARLEFRIEQRPGGKARFTGLVNTALFNSNKAAVERKREYIRVAIQEAEGLKLQAISHADVIRRLEGLRAGIPKADRFDDVELPLPDVSELRRE